MPGSILPSFTSHMGHTDSNGAHWIEFGIATYYDKPNRKILYSVENNVFKEIKDVASDTDHIFKIQITKSSDSNPYTLWWDDVKGDSGSSTYYLNNVDENHEFFAPAQDKFSKVSTAYFYSTIVKKPDDEGVAVAYYWNDDLPENTYTVIGDPVKGSKYIPSNSESFRMDSWMP